MNVTPIPTPLPGEGLVGLQPAAAPIADAGWHRHLNLFTGRALTAPALTAEQLGRVGRLAACGQAVSAGVVSGLETQFITGADHPPILQISAGRGITRAGEDVVVPSAVHIVFDDLPVYGPITLFGDAPSPGVEVVRRVGPTLGQVRQSGAALPPVGVVVLQSVVADMMSAPGNNGGCDPGQNDAFADWQIVDGCRVLFYTWPLEWATLPADDGSATWHNLVVNSIFEAERLGAPDSPPWLSLGLPICLLALDSARQQPRFVDRYAVVRAGGRARSRSPIVDSAGTPFLWQARIQQLAAQVASPDANAHPATIRDLGHQFRFLPPVGLLPRQILVHTDSTWTSQFFPDHYTVDAVPIPQEQLNTVFRACGSLAAFDATVPDRVRVLVPVAQTWFDPQLLETATVDPVFQKSVDQAVQDRAVVLQRRDRVRGWASSVTQALIGRPLAFPTPDPDALESKEVVATGTLDPTEESQIPPVSNTAVGDVVQPAQPLADLTTWLQAHTPLSDAERGQLGANGLDQFITLLESKINQANDAIDFGFVRVQTDIYRARQVMLGNTDATRLATSPVLATIAQGSTAIATRDAINQFLSAARPPVPAFAAPAPAAAEPVDVAVAPQAAESRLAAATVGNTFLSGELVRTVQPTPTTRHITVEFGGEPAVTTSETVSTPVALGIREVSSQALQAASHARLFESAEATIDDIQQQQPVVGAPVILRGVTIAERLKAPPAVEAKTYTIATRADVVGRLANLPINVDDIQAPGFVKGNAEVAIDFKTIRDQNLVSEIIAGKHDLNPTPPGAGTDDEASFFAGGIHALESTVATLRLIEGRVQAYQRALDVSRETQSALNRVRIEIDTRLKTLGDDLARARHAVATARALLQDEQTRISDMNANRLKILQEHVTFVAYHRPRTTDLLTFSALRPGIPLRGIDPGVAATLVPTCLAQSAQIPPEIQAMVDVLRDAPVRWFPFRRGVLDRFDQYDVLYGTLQAARLRAQTRAVSPPPFIPALPTPNGAMLSNALGGVIAAQRTAVSQLRINTAQLDLGVIAGQSWRTTRDMAEDYLSLGDLMEIGHGRSDVVQSAASELHDIGLVATCLFLSFRDVDPRIRLVWAERLSQYSTPVDLRNLASLPRWGDLAGLERQTMQGLTDWLYQRVDAYRLDATAIMNDLIRVCVLLASHAPVDAILAGHVPAQVQAQPGGYLHLAVDAPGVQIGMHVLLYGGDGGGDVVGHGVVEDLTPGTAAARVLAVTGGATSIQLTENARVKFVTADGLGNLV